MKTLKDNSRLAQACRRISGYLLALAGVTALAACTSHVSEDLSTAALGKSGDAVIVMAAVMDRNVEMSCINLHLQTMDGKVPQTTDGKRVPSLNFGSGTIFDSNSEMIGSAQIAPGTYKVAEVTCKRPHGQNGMLDVLSANPKGFATFSVSAGEVVNLGKLIIIEVQAEPPEFLKDARYVYVAHAVPLKSDPHVQLNKDLAARLVDRTMTLSQPPLPQTELARICQQKRLIYASDTVSAKPATCDLAGL